MRPQVFHKVDQRQVERIVNFSDILSLISDMDKQDVGVWFPFKELRIQLVNKQKSWMCMTL